MPNHPTNYPTSELVERLMVAIEGECDGLAITEAHAKAILEYVLEGSAIEAQAARIAELEGALEAAEGKVGDAYQFAGNILDHAGLWDHPEAVRALDYFAGIDGADAPGNFLPWPRCDLAAPLNAIAASPLNANTENKP